MVQSEREILELEISKEEVYSEMVKPKLCSWACGIRLCMRPWRWGDKGIMRPGVWRGVEIDIADGSKWDFELRQTATSSLLVVGVNEQPSLEKRPATWDMVDLGWGWGYLLELMTRTGVQTRLSSHPRSPWWLFNWQQLNSILPFKMCSPFTYSSAWI